MSNLETKNEDGKEYILSFAEAFLNSQTFRSSIIHMDAAENINNSILDKSVIHYIGCDDKLYTKCITKDAGEDVYNEEMQRFSYITLSVLMEMLPREIYVDLVKYMDSVMEDFCNGIEDFAPFDLINGLSEVNG